MDALRWILLLLGAVVLIAMYWLGKKAELRRKGRDEARDEPHFDDDSYPAHLADDAAAPEDEWEIIPVRRQTAERSEVSVDRGGMAHEPAPEQWVAPSTSKRSEPTAHRAAMEPESEAVSDEMEDDFQDILIMHIVAADAPLTGEALAKAFDVLDLSLDERGVYIRADERGEVPLFGVVNMVKPGVFAPGAFDDLETPGISLFLTLPGPEAPMRAFRAMSDCAKRLAERLDARLEDETHSALSAQTLTYMEERVRLFIQHRARVAGPLR
ncbi:hypothetical protein BI364_10630 [Acidihalobacter yilgarnensis]|uniref:Cell division protein ZipA n=1 Tax=Acidihalobacter yilgarnensis TaxID=2819280 RepID=A0A1D8IPF8_9GAMM|nr:cell division protein ZipA C-terminal FtsZ-binding domain-containing protein [Acidihalobacter yilgarnensis]AOU98356.1 hypothetical protein BI364_10630 [Acidihalobacter yilgarnensis]